jgi:hypothetical protein
MQLELVGKLGVVLRQDLSTASQTARWIARSTTGFEIASNVACEINAEVEIGVVRIDHRRRLLGQWGREKQQTASNQSGCQT